MNFDNYVCEGQMSFADYLQAEIKKLEEPFKIDKPIRLIELFAGVGSQAMALRDIGADFTHHLAVEIDKYAIASYNAIHGTNFPTIDITKLKGEDLGITDRDKYCYMMTYSFPCTDLSVAGKMAGMEEGSGTHSSLLWEVKRLLEETKELPQVLLMENVVQVHSKGQNEASFQRWIDYLSSRGYKSYWQDVNSRTMNVAQNRNRCFMVSVLGDYTYEFPNPMPLTRVMADYLEDEVDEKYYLTSEKARKLIDKLILNGTIPTNERTNERTNDGYIRENVIIGGMQAHQSIKTDGVCPTLTSSMGTGGGYVPMIIDSKGRKVCTYTAEGQISKD